MRIKAVILALFASVSAMASEWDMSFRHFPDYDGLWLNAIRTIEQDDFGFIWIGSDAGLYRFDGVEMRPYRLPNDMSLQTINCITDMGDSLLIGSYCGCFVLDYNTDDIHQLLFPEADNNSLIFTSIAPDKNGHIWFSTQDNGIFEYSPSNGKYTHHHIESDLRFSEVFIDNNNHIWALAYDGGHGLYRYNKNERRFKPFLLNGNPAPYSSCMLQDHNGTLWLGTVEEGILSFTLDGKIEQKALVPRQQKSHAFHVHSIMEYRTGELLIGCDNGLIRYDAKSGMSRQYQHSDTDSESLSGVFVYPVFADREGGLWIGTFYSGLNYVAPNSGKIKSFIRSEFSNSIRGNVINRFCEDERHNIWISSDDGGLCMYNPSMDMFSNVRFGNGELADNNIHALCIDGDQLWVGSYTNGLYVLNTLTGQKRHYIPDASNPNSLYGSSCYAIYRDSNGNIWIATTQGINLYRRETDDFVCIKKEEIIICDIDEDAKGRLWFSSQGNGVYCFDPKTDNWSFYKANKAYCYVNNICITVNGDVWAATDDGLLKYDEQINSFSLIESTRNMAVTAVVEGNDYLWLATNNGLYRMSDDKTMQRYDTNDGLLSNSFISNAAYMASDGRIYLGTAKGFNVFYAHQMKTNMLSPRVMITGIEVMNEPVLPDTERLQKSLNVARQIDLSHTDKIISFRFASLSYCIPQKNLYAYKLDGFDSGWHEVGNNTDATYTNLAPGTYTFRVKGTNNDGIWSSDEASIKIVVHPPFWWSMPARFIYLLLLVAAAFLLYRYLIIRDRQRHEEEAAKIRMRFFTMIAHEIRTPVSLIIGPLEKLGKTTASLSDSERNSLNIINRNANRLLDLVNQLLDFNKVESQSMVVRFSVYNISNMLHAVAERFETNFSQNNIKFDVEYPDKHLTAVIDKESITKVVSNLLTNARKYTRDYVRLSCYVTPDDSHFVIEVEDNGMGIDPKDHERIFRAFYQAADNKPGTGIGLSIVKNIVEQHHGTIAVKSSLGQGAKFTVTLPVRQEGNVEIIASNETQSQAEKSNAERKAPSVNESGTDAKDVLCNDTVLVVDDNNDMLSFLKENISAYSKVICAHDGLEAIDKLANNDITLIICDWMMPRMDGAEFCQHVRSDASTSHIPFVMLTAKTDNVSKIKGMNIGADAYIEKPFSIDYLKACCLNILNMRKVLREKYSKTPTVPITKIATSDVDKEFLQRMQAIIEENFSNPDLNVNFLADKLCISRSRLFAKIKNLADVSPNEMIQLVRLKKAALLLSKGDMKVSEVCYTVGFSNPSYFSKCFFKQFGVRPTEISSLPEISESDSDFHQHLSAT